MACPQALLRAPSVASLSAHRVANNRTLPVLASLAAGGPSSASSLSRVPVARRHQSSNAAPTETESSADSLANLSARIFNPRLQRSSHPVGYIRNKYDTSSGPGRPQDIAYFTANSKYYNLVLTLNDAVRRNGLDFRDKSVYEKSVLPSWMSRSQMAEAHDMNLEDGRYEEIVHKLNLLFSIRSQDEELSDYFFAPFVKPGATFSSERQQKQKTVDKDGFAHAKGSRKTARATVKTIEGDGIIMVNGMLASEYFDNFLTYMEDMIEPLVRTGRIGKYNVWATATGGGLSGQGQAIKLAIARCLTIHEPQLEAPLTEAGLLKPDTRQMERKKTGQPGARKKFAWVKR